MKRNTVIFECSGIGPKMLYSGSLGSKNCAKISILQVDFLEILNISRIRNENFDRIFDPLEPENNIFGPIPEHSKIMVYIII